MITESNKTVVLRKATWEIRSDDDGNGNKQNSIKPIPETWFNIFPYMQNMLALFTCPNCQTITGVDTSVSKVDHLGKLTPRFRCIPCGLHCDIYFDEYHNKP